MTRKKQQIFPSDKLESENVFDLKTELDNLGLLIIVVIHCFAYKKTAKSLV